MKLWLHWRQPGRPLRQLRSWRPTRRQLLVSVSVIGTLTAIWLLLFTLILIGIDFQALQLAVRRSPLRAVVVTVGVIIALGMLLAVIGGYYYNWRWVGVGQYTTMAFTETNRCHTPPCQQLRGARRLSLWKYWSS
jgi:hypothetical protein